MQIHAAFSFVGLVSPFELLSGIVPFVVDSPVHCTSVFPVRDDMLEGNTFVLRISIQSLVTNMLVVI